MYLFETKLHIPKAHGELLYRERLSERLQRGVENGHRLTLLSAPAGFGKTTLLVQWLAQTERDIAWLSLGEEESDPVRFFHYLIAALRRLDEQLGETLLTSLESAQQPSIHSLLPPLLLELRSLSAPFFLVLDDYHLVESTEVDTFLHTLLQHQPPLMHLVLATREDPQLPLAKLRGKRLFTEVRAGDLRLTAEECADFLRESMSLTLSEDDLQLLTARTEGWVTGLQLAALSLQEHPDSSTFLQAFAGSHRYILDYLVEEVLQQQPSSVRTFLLQTSILERLHAPLCDAVTQSRESQVMLEALERGNLFVISLDHTRDWFRYHQLFAEALSTALKRSHPASVSALHARACEWFLQHDQIDDAIHHALVAKDDQKAADLLEQVWPSMELQYQTATWFSWASQLPEEIVLQRPLLCDGYAWTMLYRGQLEASSRWLGRIEWLLSQQEVFRALPEEQRSSFLPASLCIAQLYITLALGSLPEAMSYAEDALALLGDREHYRRTQIVAMSAIAYWANGRLVRADELLSSLFQYLYRHGPLVDVIELTPLLGDIRISRGQLYRAYRAYERAFQALQERGQPLMMGCEDLYRGRAELDCEWGLFEKAEDALHTAEELAEQLVRRPNWLHRLFLSRAQCEMAQGRLDDALSSLEQAKEHFQQIPLPEVRQAETLVARVWLKQGKLSLAEEWVRKRGLVLDAPIHYLDEFDYMTFVRVGLARLQGRWDEALASRLHTLCERMYYAATEGQRGRSLIEIRLLQSLLYNVQGDKTGALECLEEALALAASEGYVQLFLNEGASLRGLIQDVHVKGELRSYVERLRTTWAAGEEATTCTQQSLIEPLTEREMEVLRMLETQRSGPEIARELYISLSTMRTHTRNIYSKLDVNNRRGAVQRALEIGLLPS